MTQTMTSAETIEAAIRVLEHARATSTPGPWVVHDMGDATYTSENNKGWWWIWQESALPFYGGVMEIDHKDDFGPGGMPIGSAARTDNQDGEQERADAELIVTLHRTIDAQLAVLRAGRTATTFPFEEETPGWAAEATALSVPLAHAVLGI